MKEREYKPNKRQAVLDQKEELLKQLHSHIEYLKQVSRRLRKIDADVEEMSDYYYSEWIEDYNHLQPQEKHYDILDQDHIHNALQDIHAEKIKLLKKIVNKLNY